MGDALHRDVPGPSDLRRRTPACHREPLCPRASGSFGNRNSYIYAIHPAGSI